MNYLIDKMKHILSTDVTIHILHLETDEGQGDRIRFKIPIKFNINFENFRYINNSRLKGFKCKSTLVKSPNDPFW